MPASKLSGHTDAYKIKLRTIGYRLVYTVKDDVVVVYVLAVGKRENNKIYYLVTSPIHEHCIIIITLPLLGD